MKIVTIVIDKSTTTTNLQSKLDYTTIPRNY